MSNDPRVFTYTNEQIAEILAAHARIAAGIGEAEKWSASIRTVTGPDGSVTMTVKIRRTP